MALLSHIFPVVGPSQMGVKRALSGGGEIAETTNFVSNLPVHRFHVGAEVGRLGGDKVAIVTTDVLNLGVDAFHV